MSEPDNIPHNHQPQTAPEGVTKKKQNLLAKLLRIMPSGSSFLNLGSPDSHHHHGPSPLSCIPVRVKIKLQAVALWLVLSLPSIGVTLVLYTNPPPEQTLEDLEREQKSLEDTNVTQDFDCYENYTVYYPVYEDSRFWMEGILLFVEVTWRRPSLDFFY